MTIPSAKELEAEPTNTDLSVTAFGQGKVLATPLGMASVAQTVANEGRAGPDQHRQGSGPEEPAKPVEVTSKANARVLTGLMRAVVTQGTGTSRPRSRASRSRARPEPPSSDPKPGAAAGASGRRRTPPSRSSTAGSSPSPRPASRSWRSR